MVVLLMLGLLDAVAGALILITNNPILPQIAKYVGWILLLKGAWSVLTGWRS